MMIETTVDRSAIDSAIAGFVDDRNPLTVETVRTGGDWAPIVCRLFESFEDLTAGLITMAVADGAGARKVDVTPTVQTGTTEDGDTFFALSAAVRSRDEDASTFFVTIRYCRASEAAEDIAELDGFAEAADESELVRLIIDWAIEMTVETTAGLRALLAG